MKTLIVLFLLTWNIVSFAEKSKTECITIGDIIFCETKQDNTKE